MKTPVGLLSLIDEGVIDEVMRPLKSGKEAAVYVVRCGDQVRCAKVYKDMAQRSFQQRVQYQEGRKVRFENNDLYNHAVSAQSIHPENVFNVTTPAGQPFEHKFKWQKNPIPIGCVSRGPVGCDQSGSALGGVAVISQLSNERSR